MVIPAWKSAMTEPIFTMLPVEQCFKTTPPVTDTARLSIDRPMAIKMISNRDTVIRIMN